MSCCVCGARSDTDLCSRCEYEARWAEEQQTARCSTPGCRNVGDADEPDVWATVDGKTYCTEWHAFRCEGCDTDYLEADRTCPHQALCRDCGHGEPCAGCAEDAHWDAAERAAEATRDAV